MTDFSEIEEFPTVPKIFRTEYKFCFNSTRNQEHGTDLLPKGDFMLPPTPTSLIADGEFYQKSRILSSAIHNEEDHTAVSGNESLSKSTSFRRAEISDSFKEWNDEGNIQIMSDISQNMSEGVVDSIHLSENNSSDPIIDKQRGSGCHIDDPRGITEENNIYSHSKANFPKILIVKPRNRYLTIPRHLPRHKKSVHFQSNSISSEINEKLSQAVQTEDVRECEHLKLFTFLDSVDFLDDGDNTEGLEANIFDKLSEDTISLHENVSNHLLSTCMKAKVQTDNKVDIAVSPIVFLTEKTDKNSPDVHGDNLSIIGTTSYIIHGKIPLEKSSPHTESKKVESHTQGSTLELVVTEPSPIIECSVVKNDNLVHPFEKNTHPKVYKQPDYNSNKWKQPATLVEPKSILYATVMASESEGSQIINHNRMNVVVVDDTTSTHHCLPPQNLLIHRGFDDVGYQTAQWYNKRTRISHPSVTSVRDQTLSRQNSCHRLLVSSVSSEHRPFQSRNSSCVSTLTNSCTSRFSCDPSLSHSCHTLDDTQSSEEESSVSLQEMNPLAQEIHSVNLIQATPEKKPLTPVPHLSSGRDSQHLKGEIAQNAPELEERHIETRELGCSPVENRKRIIQEWLIHRISANVAGHFGSKLTQMFHEEDSNNGYIKKDLNCKNVDGTCLRLPMKDIQTRSRITIGKSDEKNKQLRISQEHKQSSSLITNNEQSRNEIQPIELIENVDSNHNIDLNKGSLNNQRMNGQKRIIMRTQQWQSVPRMQLRPRISVHKVNSGKNEAQNLHEFEEVLEIDPHDDIVKSHLNSHDRRIKSVSMKTGCYLSMKGPIKVPSLDGTLKRDKEVYELTIGAPNRVKADRCVNFLRETFPHTAFLRKQAQVRILNKF